MTLARTHRFLAVFLTFVGPRAVALPHPGPAPTPPPVPEAPAAPPAAPAVAATAARIDDPYAVESTRWREQREQRLRSDDGWLTLVGLSWLSTGRQSLGSAPQSAVPLPASAPAHAGFLELQAGQVRYELAPGVEALLDGQPAPARGALAPDSSGHATRLAFGSVSLYIIDRQGKLGVRVKDREAPTRRAFAGLEWYPLDPRWRVRARFEPHAEPRQVRVPNVLGHVELLSSPGRVSFEVDGATLRLEPVLESDDAQELFFIFRDGTSGKTTYGGGRFLYTPLPREGFVELDFNRAYSPPCAFTTFATCPLPPEGNRLSVKIEAGEKFAGHH